MPLLSSVAGLVRRRRKTRC
ncbi:hypothetical protein [Glaciimonas sp. PCH181]